MAEIVVSAFATLVLDKLGSLATQELNPTFGVENQLQILKLNFSAIQAVLRDAENQQSTTESVKNWLENLEDIVYEIDDLLDEISYEALLAEKNQGDWRRKVRKFFSTSNSVLFRSKLGHWINDLSRRLESIAKVKEISTLSTLGLVDLDEERETHSRLPDWEIMGREEERIAIVDRVLSFGECPGLSVIPILGLGGIGKTTLAQLVYHDDKIHANFEMRLWVYVLENTKNVRNILEKVFRLVSGENARELSLEELQIKLAVVLKGKKYLLVLDDFWNDDPDAWGKLRIMLNVGAKGSTIIVTTCVSRVAAIVETSSSKYNLQGLSSDVCLTMFKKLAFREDSPTKPLKFERMAEEIVETCDGSPLTVTVLGNLLRCQMSESVWEDVVWKLQQGNEDLLRVLKLSYVRLPSYLKPCFRVMPAYPKGADSIYFPHLMSTWMALGFLQPDDHDQHMELTGRRYMHQLLSKSLLDDPKFIFGDRVHWFKIHDCINDMARLVAGDDVAIVNCSVNRVSERARYVLFNEDNLTGSQFRKEELKAKKARVFSLRNCEQNQAAFVEDIITNFRCLRVLNLRGCDVEKLPRSIGQLKHLRMLDLHSARIRLLPDSVCDLLNLQTLLLNGCMQLQELPHCIGRLERLRVLTLTTKQERWSSEMGLLIALRKLVLYQCQALTSLPQSMKSFKNLEELWIMSCENMDLMSSSSIEIFRGLNLLNTLVIDGPARFTGLPMEIGGLSTSLRYLSILNCQDVTDLAGWIEQFGELETLNLVECLRLSALPNDFRSLGRLKRLSIYGCPALSKICVRNTGDDWHLISHIPDIKVRD